MICLKIADNKKLMQRPIGYDKTNKMLTLEQIVDSPETLKKLNELSLFEKKNLVIEAWKTGNWVDVYYGNEFIDLKRAIGEVESDTKLGQTLLKIGLRASEIILEELEKEKNSVMR